MKSNQYVHHDQYFLLTTNLLTDCSYNFCWLWFISLQIMAARVIEEQLPYIFRLRNNLVFVEAQVHCHLQHLTCFLQVLVFWAEYWPVASVQCFLLFLYSICQFHLYSSLLSCYFSLHTKFSTIKLPHDCKKVPNQPCLYTRFFQRYPPSYICIIRSTHGLWWANVCVQNNFIVRSNNM